MAKIKNVKGRQVFDSRGNPTVEAEVLLDSGISATAISPSGASTGAFEAHELRDKDNNKFLGKSVNIAVENINNKIFPKLKGLNPDDQLYSWWDYRMAGYRRNLGMRIDHILSSESLRKNLFTSYIDEEPRKLERPSDHTPVITEFK